MQGFRLLARNDFVWWILNKSLLKVTRHLSYHRDCVERERASIEEKNKTSRFVNSISPDTRVLSGLFKGMQYPKVESFGSALIPKFLGCYESEIAENLGRLIANHSYDRIIDIGSAEGYYAVGMALAVPRAKVFAYDISTTAQSMCSSLADLNGVSDRVTVRGLCTPSDLCDLLDCGRALVIIDCEGAEAELLTEDVAKASVGHDLIVELHDTVVPGGVTEQIESRFKASHKVVSIAATHDCIKARTYQLPSLVGMSFDDRLWAVSEQRLTGVEWCFLLSEPCSSAAAAPGFELA